MTLPLVRLRGLRVAFPDRARKPLFGAAPMIEVVKGIDLDIPRGCALGLVGESGSGKTTIGRALVRLIRPSGGELIYDGVDIAAWEEERVHPLRAKLQMIFQDPQSSLNPRLTIGTTLVRPLQAFGRGGDGAGTEAARGGAARHRRAALPPSSAGTRTRFPAASASASASPGRWRCGAGVHRRRRDRVGPRCLDPGADPPPPPTGSGTTST